MLYALLLTPPLDTLAGDVPDKNIEVLNAPLDATEKFIAKVAYTMEKLVGTIKDKYTADSIEKAMGTIHVKLLKKELAAIKIPEDPEEELSNMDKAQLKLLMAMCDHRSRFVSLKERVPRVKKARTVRDGTNKRLRNFIPEEGDDGMPVPEVDQLALLRRAHLDNLKRRRDK